MSRLVAVSNRVGAPRGAASAGGLAVALVEALQQSGGLWFGWSGKTTSQKASTARLEHEGGLTLVTLDLPKDEYDGYYFGFSNRCLWPACHFRPDLIDFDHAAFEAYSKVNRRFAQALAPLLRDDDLIWVHDYQLLPLAHELRKLGATQRIGFFLHIPFPPPDLLVALPVHATLVDWLFDYDLVGLQTERDVHRLHDYLIQEAGGRVDGPRISANNRETRVAAFPIGIDAQQFNALARSPAGSREFNRMREALRGRTQIIGVDRLDYSKGLLRRMHAFERLLERHPKTHGNVEYLQVAPLSRRELKAYEDFRLELEHGAARINGRFASFDWTPLRYLTQPLPRRTLAGLYRASRIGLVTPLRDGMNLVAKEYVAAQDPEDPGVLVLSRFAGAAAQMTMALQVNPYDLTEVADAIERARTMPLAARQLRRDCLFDALQRDDVAHWRTAFIDALQAGTAGRAPVPVRAASERRRR